MDETPLITNSFQRSLIIFIALYAVSLEVENDEEATINLWRKVGIKVLPGSYLSRDTSNGNPGKNFIRVALVESINDITRGLHLIKENLYN